MLTHHWPSAGTPGRVVVLGASGFVGRELMAHLKGAGRPALGLSSRDVDLLQPSSVDRLAGLIERDDAVVVISALTPDKGRDTATMMKNLRMAEHLSAALAIAPCGHLTYLSSDAVYDDQANPVRETSLRHPSTLYGLMHLVRERMLAEVAGEKSVPYAILRPSLLFGAGDTHNGYGPNRFVRTARESRKITLFGHGEEKRDHVYVVDLCRLVGEVLRHRSSGVLNVATGVSRSFFDVAETIRRLSSGVELELLPRVIPVTHRHFDVIDTVKAFGSFQFTAFAEAMGRTVDPVARPAA